MTNIYGFSVGDVIKITRYNGDEVEATAEVINTCDTGLLRANQLTGKRLMTYLSGYIVLDLEDAFERISSAAVEVTDVVSHPPHYNSGRFETIEIIEEITQGYDDGFVAHCAGTAIKYISRAPHKHDTPTEDLRKAAKYLEFAIERLEAEESKR
ncbi:hypothetical protein JOC34_002838 [Virgibacillus halotolerans]|uniref:DUF3310 domain-containing protein n=1 Tax=Virgibacillus halotolerans TaxID=1071053 RepID=UPI001960D04D|nr:DUF3310 domain-containing protein [Virgibacillus halotolerans]MBM7600447.1 hypothetical protein [Virgibacillus halotolerans]